MDIGKILVLAVLVVLVNTPVVFAANLKAHLRIEEVTPTSAWTTTPGPHNIHLKLAGEDLDSGLIEMRLYKDDVEVTSARVSCLDDNDNPLWMCPLEYIEPQDEEEYTWKVKVLDVGHNWDNCFSKTWDRGFDTHPPTVSVVGGTGPSWATSATASVGCSDATAGCDANSYRLKEYMGAEACSTDYNEYFPVGVAGINVTEPKWYCAAASDTLGHWGYSPTSVEFRVDIAAPTVTVEGAPVGWVSTFQDANISCTDTGSGCVPSSVAFLINTSDPGVCSGPLSGYTPGDTYPISSHVWVCGGAADVAGNEGFSAPIEYRVDMADPVTTTDYPYNDQWMDLPVVNVSLYPNDTESGIAWTRYCMDTDNTCDPASGSDYAFPTYITDEGMQYYRYASADNAGNVEATQYLIIKIERSGPTTSDNASALDGVWVNSNVVVELTCTDTGSGCDRTYYSYDGTDPPTTLYTNPFTLSVPGQYQLRYYSIDNGGHAESTVLGSRIWIDKTSPSTTSDAPVGWQPGDVVVNLVPSDTGGSGVLNTLYCVDQSDTCVPDTSGTQVTVTQEGTNYVRYASVDIAGNQEVVNSDTVLIDKTNPTITDDYANDGVWVNSAQVVTLTPSSPIGVDTVMTCEGIGCAPGTVLVAPYVLNYNTEQDTVVRYLVNDTFGRTSAIGEFNVKIDLTDPVTTSDAPAGWQTSDVVVTLAPSDTGGSGLSDTLYCVDQADSCAPSTSGTSVSVTTDGTNYVRYYSSDTAGNQEVVNSDMVLIDKTNPTITDDYASDGSWINANQSVTLTPNAPIGVDTVMTCEGVGCSPGTVLVAPYVLNYTGEQNTTVRYLVNDTIGRISVTGEFNVLIDLTDPVTTSDAPVGWQTDNVTVNMTPSDSGGSGLADTLYCVDQADSCAPSTSGLQVTVTQEGINYVRYASVDIAGNQEVVNSDTVLIDMGAPVTSDNASAITGWVNYDVDVELTCIAGASSCDTTWYSTDGSFPTTVYTGPFTLSGTGQYQLMYYSNDTAGNVESVVTGSLVMIDQIAPATTDNASAINDTWVNYNVNVLLDCVDSDSGCDTTLFSTDGSPPSNIYSGLFSLTTGQYQLRYFSNDTAGNVEGTVTGTIIKVDTEVPVTISDAPAGWQSEYIMVNLTPSDTGGSALADTLYCVDQNDSCVPSNSGLQVNVTTDGTNYVRYASVDNAGNQEVVNSDMVQIDTIGPTITDDYAYDGIWVNANQAVTLTPWELSGGVDTVTTCEGIGCTPNVILLSPYELNYSGEQNTTVRYMVNDTLGNPSPIGEFNVLIDLTDPVTTSDAPAGWQTSNVTVNFSPSDLGGSGLSDTLYCVDQNDTCVPSNSGLQVNVTTDGTNYVRYASVDNAGNQEVVNSDVVQIDRNNPTIIDDYMYDGVWASSNQTVQLTPIDVESGISTVMTCEGVGCVPITILAAPYVLNYTGEQNTTVRYQAWDNAINPSAIGEFNVLIDQTDPVTVSDAPVGWQNGNVTVNLLPSDLGGSGLNDTLYCVDQNNTCAPATSGVSVDFTSEGVYYLRYYSTDIAGNQEDANSDKVNIDFTDPVFSNFTIGDVTEDTVGGINASVLVEDMLSSVNTTAPVNLWYRYNATMAHSSAAMGDIGNGYWEGTIPEPVGGWNQYAGNMVEYFVEAEDNAGNVANSSVQFEWVDSINDPPVIDFTSIDGMALVEDTYNDSINMNDYVTDEYPTFASWNCSSDQADVLVSVNASNIMTISAVNDWNGLAMVSCTVTDTGGLQDQDNFTVNVTPVNDAPVLEPIGNQTALTTELFYLDVDASDVDIGDTLTFTDDSPVFNINPLTGVIQFVPDIADVGSYTVNITVTDGTVVVYEVINFEVRTAHGTSVDSVEADTFLTNYVGDSIEVRVNVTNIGDYNESVTVNLKDGESVVDTKANVPIAAGATEQVTFYWVPATNGYRTITVESEPLGAEEDVTDNYLSLENIRVWSVDEILVTSEFNVEFNQSQVGTNTGFLMRYKLHNKITDQTFYEFPVTVTVPPEITLTGNVVEYFNLTPGYNNYIVRDLTSGSSSGNFSVSATAGNELISVGIIEVA